MMPPGSASAAGAIGRGLSTAAEARRGAPLSAEEIRSQLLAAGGGGGGGGQRQNRGSWLELGRDVDLALESLARSDCVCFDVDSTVVGEEGIDVLADYLGHGKEVADLTRAAMEGGMKFQDALKLRLDLLRPSLPQIQACLRDRPLRLTPGVQELVSELGASGKDVWLVSGGFRLMIEPVARQLGIPGDRIVANTLRFRPETGEYLDFDPDEPTSADMGKPRALERIRASRGYSCMVMVGDGATDAQAKPPASAFVGFGGVVSREPVRRVADWFVADFAPLAEVARIARGSPPSASAGRTSAQ
jgi:phosphoserine phosphatase